jgi:hypothetical protein
VGGNCIDTAICTYSLPLLIAPSSRDLPHIDPFLQEDSTLSQRKVGMPEFNELIDMARLLVNLWEAAQRLPQGSERRDALRQISDFQGRVAALVTRAF